MNKKKLIQFLTQKIADELAAITQAAKNTYDDATSAETKAENKYDTRSLEASYLAGAQAQRVSDMKEVLAIFENLPIKDFLSTSKIMLTALVQVSLVDKQSYLLIMPKGGGQSAIYEGLVVQVITPDSPLGKALVGRSCGDFVEVQAKGKLVEYEIVEVW